MPPSEKARCTSGAQLAHCWLCGGEQFTSYRGVPGLLRCLDCGLVFRHPQPRPEALEALYEEAYFRSGEKDFGYVDYAASGEALHREAVSLGVINSENILEGLETDLRIAKAINGLHS